MSSEADAPISIACTSCHNQVEKTREWLRANEEFKCPTCGHSMKSERAAVIRHIEAIQTAIAEIGAGADSSASGKSVSRRGVSG